MYGEPVNLSASRAFQSSKIQPTKLLIERDRERYLQAENQKVDWEIQIYHSELVPTPYNIPVNFPNLQLPKFWWSTNVQAIGHLEIALIIVSMRQSHFQVTLEEWRNWAALLIFLRERIFEELDQRDPESGSLIQPGDRLWIENNRLFWLTEWTSKGFRRSAQKCVVHTVYWSAWTECKPWQSLKKISKETQRKSKL